MNSKAKKPLPKPAHAHAWHEDGKGAAQACDYFFTCRCGATKEVYLEQDGTRTDVWEPTGPA